MKVRVVAVGLAVLVAGGGIAVLVLLGRGGDVDVAQGSPPPTLGRFDSLAPGGEFSVIGRIIASGPEADKICFADAVVGTDGQGVIIGARGTIGYAGMDVATDPPLEAFAALTELATDRLQSLVDEQVLRYDPALLPDGSLPRFSAANPDGLLRGDYHGAIHYDREGRLVSGYAFCEDTTAELLAELNSNLVARLAAEEASQPR